MRCVFSIWYPTRRHSKVRASVSTTVRWRADTVAGLPTSPGSL